jgi:hypothetical protein
LRRRCRLRVKIAPDSTPTGERGEPIAADARPLRATASGLLKVAAGLIVLPFDNVRKREAIADTGDYGPSKQSESESREVYWAGTGLAGRLDPILASYRAAQSSADRLAKADPGNVDWQCVSKKNGETATALDMLQLGRAIMVRLREKGGKRHEMPCRHDLGTYLHAYLEGSEIAADPKGPLFRTIGRTTGQLTTTPLPQANAHAMIRRRAAGASIKTQVGNHTFRATGITAYLKNGGTLENAAAIANHASTAPRSSTIAGAT